MEKLADPKRQTKYTKIQLQAKLIKEGGADYKPADSPTRLATMLEKDRDLVKESIKECWNPSPGGNAEAVGWIIEALEKLGM